MVGVIQTPIRKGHNMVNFVGRPAVEPLLVPE